MPEISDYDYRSFKDWQENRTTVRFIIKCVAASLVLFVAGFFMFRLATPQLNLYKANTEKQARIAESKAKAEAALFDAEAEVARATGAAEANAIIASSLTEEYLRYLYIQNLDVAGASVIYVPTEAGLPILEAQRLNPANPQP